MTRRALAALALLALCAAPRPARATIFDFLPNLLDGQAAPKLPGDATKDKPRQIYLNGFPLKLQTGRSDKPVKDVLDYYQSIYRGGAFYKVYGQPIGVRKESGNAGSLLTAEVPDEAAARRLIKDRGYLPSAGPLRLVYARRTGLQTDYMVVWSEQSVPQEVLLPSASGDAPGQDIPDAPRPFGARRFSFTEPKAGYRLAVYGVEAPPDAALRQAATRLSGAGWTEDPQFSAAASRQRRSAARFTRGQKDVVVTARPGKGGARQSHVSYLARDLS